jgi:hypothetical protein
MTHQWDEFSKSLAESVPRRESLRRLGALLAGAVLSPLAAGTAWAGGKAPPTGNGKDPCTDFCNKCPRSRRPNCLFACRACNNNPSRLCGDCWTGFRCCGAGETCCGNYTCHNLENEIQHCGACYNYCDAPGPFEVGACIRGNCEYSCVEGAVVCDGTCSVLNSDPNNCGACGNVCPASAPSCIGGICRECGGGSTNCGGYCAFLAYDPYNCGACGFVCTGTGCVDGVCDFGVPPDV